MKTMLDEDKLDNDYTDDCKHSRVNNDCSYKGENRGSTDESFENDRHHNI